MPILDSSDKYVSILLLGFIFLDCFKCSGCAYFFTASAAILQTPSPSSQTEHSVLTTPKTLKKTHKNHLHKQPVALESEKYNIQTELNLLCSLQQTSVFS